MLDSSGRCRHLAPSPDPLNLLVHLCTEVEADADQPSRAPEVEGRPRLSGPGARPETCSSGRRLGQRLAGYLAGMPGAMALLRSKSTASTRMCGNQRLRMNWFLGEVFGCECQTGDRREFDRIDELIIVPFPDRQRERMTEGQVNGHRIQWRPRQESNLRRTV